MNPRFNGERALATLAIIAALALLSGRGGCSMPDFSQIGRSQEGLATLCIIGIIVVGVVKLLANANR